MSLAIYNEAEQQVRRLLVESQRETGKHPMVWDGLNDRGEPVPVGEYEWRLASGQGIKSQFKMLLGTSKGYLHWPEAHQGPGTVEVVDGVVIMASHLIEGSSQHIAFDLKTGDRKYRQSNASGFGWVNNVAAGKNKLFVNGYSIGANKSELLTLDLKTG